MNPEDLKKNYKELFSTPEGRIVLEDLEKRFSFQTTTFVPNSDETIFREGQRSVVIFLNGVTKDNKQLNEGEINV